MLRLAFVDDLVDAISVAGDRTHGSGIEGCAFGKAPQVFDESGSQALLIGQNLFGSLDLVVRFATASECLGNMPFEIPRQHSFRGTVSAFDRQDAQVFSSLSEAGGYQDDRQSADGPL